MDTSEIFDRMAPRYEELRMADASWWEVFDATLAAGLGAATRVLDVGCGTGRFAAAVVERVGARVWGVDPSAGMVAEARARKLRGASFRQAPADALRFRDGWFDAAVLRLSVHTLGETRPAAFAELARVLSPGGSVYLWTFPPEHFREFYLAPYLPSLPAIDLARFPDPALLADELRAAGFADVSEQPLDQHGTLPRDVAAERLRGGYISTIHLLPPDEVEHAIARLEREHRDGAPPLATHVRWRLLRAVASPGADADSR